MMRGNAASPALRALAVQSQRLAARVQRDPLPYVRLLPPQQKFLLGPERIRLFRAGNQWLGKTFTGLYDDVLFALGRHPTSQTHRPPVIVWILCASWSQSIQIQAKLWAMAPQSALAPGQTFHPKNGLGRFNPVLLFGNGSRIEIHTTQQEALDLSGATIHRAHFDEPPDSERVYHEVIKRLTRTNGRAILTLTPINRPVAYLRQEVEAGKIADYHFRLRPESLVPLGSQRPMRLTDGTSMDAAWCEAFRASAMAYEEPVVIDGEWETRMVDRIFGAFIGDPMIIGTHVRDAIPTYELLQHLGIDHGDDAGKQAGILLAVDETKDHKRPTFYVVDEDYSDGKTSVRQDAGRLIAMMRRHGIEWSDLDEVIGDIPFGGKNDPTRKSNYRLAEEVARELGLKRREELKPFIKTAKAGQGNQRGSVRLGVQYLHDAMIEGRFFVHPRCVVLIEALQKWQGADDKWKHAIDALRYAAMRWVWGRQSVQLGPRLVVR